MFGSKDMSATAILPKRLTSTVAQELAVAVTGVLLVLFIFSHLAANLLIILGPEALNYYADTLHTFGPLLVVARIGLAATFFVHIGLAIKLSIENRKKRSQAYAVDTRHGRKGPATRFMALSGIMIACFLILHLTDFPMRDPHGPNSIINGEDRGLGGLVFNFLSNPIRAFVYIVAVSAVGLHLSHALSSVVVTLGFLTDKATPRAELIAKSIGLVVALGFASIPIYVMLKTYVFGGLS
jgi:succinate dehydrogenase / fumarate reductase cytochrome b subunit